VKTIDRYLSKLNESGAIFLVVMLFQKLFFLLCMKISLYYRSKKREVDLENKLYEVTGKRYNIFSLNDSAAHAFVFTYYKQNIYITKGLIKLLNERELIAVLLHEATHLINYDVLKRDISGYGGSLFLVTIFGAIENIIGGKVKSRSVPLAISMFVISFIMACLLLIFMSSRNIKIEKQQETVADISTVKYGYGKDLITALNKINKVNTKQLKELSAKNPEIEKLDELLKNLDNHPEVKERIERLLEEEKLYIAMVQGNVKKIKELFRIYFTL
jgi:Zn-dependent protease with chaperone function